MSPMQASEFNDFPAVVDSTEVVSVLYGSERLFIDRNLSARARRAPTVTVIWRGFYGGQAVCGRKRRDGGYVFP